MSATSTAKTPAHSSAMDVPRRPSPAPAPSPIENPQQIATTQTATPERRVVNMNYVVIQSFPDDKIAKDAADLLNRSGVACTVIQSLPRWTNKTQWFSIVGTKAFGPRSSGTPEYEAYLTKIEEVSAAFAGRSKWKRFEPQSYRWGADSEK